MIRKKPKAKLQPSGAPKRAIDANQPLNFPTIGATMSPYTSQYLQKVNARQNPAQTKPPKNHRLLKRLLKIIGIAVVAIVLIASLWVGWKFVRNVGKVFKGSIFGLFSSSQLKGQSDGRVTILLAGYSADDPGHQGADLTDSVMLVSINTKNDTAFMLSIPRDLWVDIPGFGYEKINAAYEDGQGENFSADGYPNGGMGLLEEVINQDLGIPIDYYALIDYTAFRDAVDAVNGITIDIQSPDPRGLYDPNTNLNLPNGEVTLNGQEALNLARARGDGYGAYGFPQADFDRTEHQRQMLVALKTKALTLGIASNPIKLGELFDSLGNNVKTDFQTSDIQSLYKLANKISNPNIQSLTLSENGTNALLQPYVTPDYEDALIPVAGIGNYSDIQAYITSITTPPQTN